MEKSAFVGKLPGGPPTKKRKMKGELPPAREPYTTLDAKQFKTLLGSKPAYPTHLDFNSSDYSLTKLDFLLGCSDVLKEIDLTRNNLTDCSTGVFEHLGKLKCLIIDDNALLDIQFKGLTSLATLSLANNKLNYLTDMADLKHLVYLDLSGNNLQAGYDQLCKLKSLKVLDLGNNKINATIQSFWRSFSGLSRLPKLQYLSFAGNPCEHTIHQFRLFAVSEFKQIKFFDWQEITKEERGTAGKLEAAGEWKDKTAAIEKSSSKNRFSGVKEVAERLKEEKEKRLSRGVSAHSKEPVRLSTGKGALLEELLNSAERRSVDNLDDLIPPGDDKIDLAASGGDPLDEILNYLSDNTALNVDDGISPPKGSQPPPPSAAPSGESETVDYLSVLNGIIQSSELDTQSTKAPIKLAATRTEDSPKSPKSPAKTPAVEPDYLEMLIDTLKSDDFAGEKSGEKEIEIKPPKIVEPQQKPKPGIPTDESIFNLLDQIMESKPSRKSSTPGLAAVEESLAKFEDSLNLPGRKELEQKKVEEEKQKLLELERKRHSVEIKRLQLQQQQELDRQRAEIEEERKRLLDMAAHEKSERRKTQQLLELLVEEDRNREEEIQKVRAQLKKPQQQQPPPTRQTPGVATPERESVKSLLQEAQAKRTASSERRQLEQELLEGTTGFVPTARTPPRQVSGGTPVLGGSTPKASPSPTRLTANPMQATVDDLMQDLMAVDYTAPKPEPREIKHWLCRYDELQFGEKMGLGTYGTSYRGSLRGKGPVVIKKLHCQRFKDSFVEALKNEAAILRDLQHPNLVEWKALCTDTDLCVVTEYVEGVSLENYLQNPGNTIALSWAIDVAKDIAEAVNYLHSKGVLHRSLKTSNILVQKETGKVKLNDYGMLLVKEEVSRSGQIGYPQYSAPEVIRKVESTPKSDVYSFGMVLCELFSRIPPFNGLLPREVAEAVTDKNQRPPLPVCPIVFTKLIQACWNSVPQKRPTFDILIKILSQPKHEVAKFAPETPVRDPIPHPGSQPMHGPTATAGAANGGQTDGRAAYVVDKILQMLDSPDIQLQLKALRATYNFCADDENKDAVIHSPLLPTLVRVCTNSDDIIREQAVVVIGLLAEGEANANKLGEEGAVGALLTLCGGGNNDMILAKALKSLEKLALESAKTAERAGETVVSVLLGLMSHNNELVKMQAIATLNAFLPRESNQLLFYKLGGVQLLLSALNTTNPGIQLRVLETFSILTNNDKMEAVVQKVGLLQRLVVLLEAKSPLLQRQAILSISKFAQRDALRDEMYRRGVMTVLMRLYADGISDEKNLSDATQTLINFAENRDRVLVIQQFGGMAPYLRVLQGVYPEELKIHVAHLILRLLQHAEDNQRDFISRGGVPALLQVASAPGCLEELQGYILECLHVLSPNEDALLMMVRGDVIALIASQFLDSSKKEKIQSKAVSILSLMSAVKENKELFPESDAICALVPLMDSSDEMIRRGALISVANLADNERCRQNIMEEDGLVPLLRALRQAGDDHRLSERLVWSLSYFATDMDSHATIRMNGIDALVNLLTHEKVPVVSLTLKTLLILVVKSGENKAAAVRAGISDKVRALTGSPNNVVATAAQKLLTLLA